MYYFTCISFAIRPSGRKSAIKLIDWSPYLKGDVQHLEKVERRATRLKGFKKLQYEERLRRLGLKATKRRSKEGYEDTRDRNLYKILTGKEKVDRNDFFKLQTRDFHNTRGHSYKLETTRSRLELRRNFFSQRVTSHWKSGINCQRRWSKQKRSTYSRTDWITSGALSVRAELFSRQQQATSTSTSTKLI